ncbi:DUF2877 domain-containing protein [Enterococcus raffinosus]|uniref:DUF2877 domain-containing protein n=1 Tax=Enterococcus raffinosus TaxID=71452 RepID=UPI001C0FFC30|nr:DUF2877 domain-containing protein [Enterococcus raffinosus]MBU5362972.1 DUF2877 domain-containing protein [Enterococcus raffinosus]
MYEERARISSYLSTLDHFGKIGKIHSIFEHSLNLIFEEHLINLTESGNFLSSFGIQLSQVTFQEILPFCQLGNVIKMTEHSLTVYSQLGIKRVLFSDIQVVPLNIRIIKPQVEPLLTLRKILNTKQLEKRLGLFIGNRERRYFNFLQNTEIKNKKWSALVEYFVGRGKGLTPSGDDLIMGYLFILKIYGHKVCSVLESQLQEASDLTTDVSWNYLSVLLSGYASSPFIELLSGLEERVPYDKLDQLVDEILAIGHTSGSDSCYGILLGLSAVQRNFD